MPPVVLGEAHRREGEQKGSRQNASTQQSHHDLLGSERVIKMSPGNLPPGVPDAVLRIAQELVEDCLFRYRMLGTE